MNFLRTVAVPLALFVATVANAATPAAGHAGETPDVQKTVSAVWVEREVKFAYMGLTSYYSCDGIQDKVEAILAAIGARPGFKVDTRFCINSPGVERMPWVTIRAALPRPATPEVMEEVAKSDAQRALAAKAKGHHKSPTPEATAPFPARWRTVQLVGDPLGPVQQGDCELVDEMRKQVFEQLGARVVENHMACVPRAVTPGSLNLTLEVLEPVTEKK